MYPFIIKKNS